MNGLHDGKALRVVIVGAGIGGLTSAIALRRQGHDVELYEGATAPNETGAAINVVPNAASILLKLGVDVRESGAVVIETMRLLKRGGELLEDRDMLASAGRWQAQWLMTHRAHLHEHLRSVAISEDGIGRPAILHYARKASKVIPETATVHFEDGSTANGDVVIGADGVHSAAREAISGSTKARRGVHSAFRFLVTRSAAREDPRTAAFFDRNGSMDMWYGEDRKVVVYPCSKNDVLNFVCIHPAELSAASSGYNTKASKSLLMEIFRHFDPVVLAMLEKAEEDSLRVYPLFDMEPLSTFVKGRMALTGDAAHPFLPHLAQGGGQAMEDGVSLGVMLSGHPSTEEIESRLHLYNDARYQRASLVQKYTRIVGGDGVKEEDSTAEKLSLNDYLEYGLSHDEFDASRAILRRWKWLQDPGLHWQQPIGFGPSHAQSHAVPERPLHDYQENTMSYTATSTFKTSATRLRSLFPTSAYSFDVRDTVAYASFRLFSSSSADRTTGDRYDALGLYIHNVHYTKRDGTTITGDYLPVTFVNSANAAITEREKFGLPVVYSDVSIDSGIDSVAATASWNGQIWAKLHWTKLTAEDTATKDAFDGGLLMHKCAPSAGRKAGMLPEGHAMVINKPSRVPNGRPVRRRCPGAAVSLTFDALDEQRLPTLHHIVSVLAEMPVLEVLHGLLEEDREMPDFRAAADIEYVRM